MRTSEAVGDRPGGSSTGDGVERFFAQAAARGFRTTLRRRCQRVLVCELRLDPSASRPVEDARAPRPRCTVNR